MVRQETSNSSQLIVGVDLGGTRFRVAALTPEGQILRRLAEPTRVEEGVDAILRRIYAAIREVVAVDPSRQHVVVAVAAPGPLDPYAGVVFAAPNMPGWKKVPLKAMMEMELAVPVYIGNDANVAALGEHRFGAGRGKSDFIYITVSTGVGGGIIVANKLLLGAKGLAGEVGHIIVDTQGTPCLCGGHDCLEAVASGTSIARRARVLAGEGVPTVLLHMAGGDVSRISAELVEQAALAGDRLAVDVMRRAAEALGIGISSLVHIFNPQMVVIGGGVSRAGSLLFSPIWSVVRERTMPSFLTELEIVPAQLGDDAGLLGCAALTLAGRA